MHVAHALHVAYAAFLEFLRKHFKLAVEQFDEFIETLKKLANNEYLLAGTGIVVTFASAYEKTHEQQQVLGEDGFVAAGTQDSSIKSQVSSFKGVRKGIASVDEVSIDEEGRMHYQRRLNGDQDHQGRHVRISCGEWKILHVKLYDYK